MNISVVFFSDFHGTAYKAPRLTAVFTHLHNASDTTRGYGVRTRSENHGVMKSDAIAVRTFRLPTVLHRIFSAVGYPFGRSNIGRLVANSWLAQSALLFGALRDCDILITQPQLSQLIRKAQKRKITVVVEHDLDCPAAHLSAMRYRYQQLDIPRRHWQSWNSSLYVKQIEAGLRNATAIIVFSQYARQTLVSCHFPADRIKVHLPPPRNGCFVASNVDSRPTFVWVGNHGIRKGIDILLEAWREHQKEHRPGILHLFGEESPADSSYRVELRSETNVVDHGSSDLLAFLSSQRSIVVLPTVSEGFPRSVTEAMACGGSAILPTGIAAGVIENGANGWTCEPTPAGVAEALRTASNEWNRIHTFGDRAAERINALTHQYPSKVLRELLAAARLAEGSTLPSSGPQEERRR